MRRQRVVGVPRTTLVRNSIIDGEDLRLAPLGARTATLARVLSRAAPGLRLNEHMQDAGVPPPCLQGS
jgi:hypothetical protein